jgi:molybdopterin molybdotransferase
MSDCCSAPGLMPFEQALSLVLSAVRKVDETEELPIESSLNRVLAEAVVSPMNVPPAANSAMDGYAFSFSSLAKQSTLTIVGKAMAGEPFNGDCEEGQCVRIMTGAIIPEQCDTVVMQEHCLVDGDTIRLTKNVKQGDHIRQAGEDIQHGASVFESGRRLSAVDIGLLASLGIAQVKVYRRLKVALIATGDELKRPGEVLASGDIYESNAHVLQQLLTKLGAEVIDFGIIKDDYQAIKRAFELADQQADAVISSGGVSVGDADYTKMVLDELGHIQFWKIAMKPGKPFAFGQLNHSVFFGLPGNPVSALVTAYQLALPALNKMQGAKLLNRLKLQAITTAPLKKSPGRCDFQRGILSTNEQGDLMVQSTGSQGSGILSSIAKANCFIVLPAEQGAVTAGEKVTVELFDHFLS